MKGERDKKKGTKWKKKEKKTEKDRKTHAHLRNSKKSSNFAPFLMCIQKS